MNTPDAQPQQLQPPPCLAAARCSHRAGGNRRAVAAPLRLLTFCVQYRDGVSPNARASVHSRVTMMRTPFFFAMVTTARVGALLLLAGLATGATGATR